MTLDGHRSEVSSSSGMEKISNGATQLRRLIAPNRNGGRHCCQPPLRRAKDLPVSCPKSQGTYFKSPSSPAQASLPIKQLPRERSFDRLPDCATRGFACRSTIVAWSEDQNRPMFRGPSWVDHSSVSLCPSTRRLPNRVALEGRSTLPAPLPDWHRKPPKSFTLPVGGDRSFRHPPLPSGRCRLSGGGGDFRPDHPCNMHVASESGKRKKR